MCGAEIYFFHTRSIRYLRTKISLVRMRLVSVIGKVFKNFLHIKFKKKCTQLVRKVIFALDFIFVDKPTGARILYLHYELHN